jgi:hypothetical protein
MIRIFEKKIVNIFQLIAHTNILQQKNSIIFFIHVIENDNLISRIFETQIEFFFVAHSKNVVILLNVFIIE